MQKILFALPLAAALAACGSNGGSEGGASKQQIKVVGSSTVYPFTTAVAEQFQRDNPERQRDGRIDRHGRGHEAFLRRRRREFPGHRECFAADQEKRI